MSLDYPNRNDWLAVRRTPSKLRTDRVVWNRGTYAPGRNKAKRRAAALNAEDRRKAVVYLRSLGVKAPKHRNAIAA